MIYDEQSEMLAQKAAWWKAVKQQRDIKRKNQNGVLDVVIGLIQAKAFK